MINVSGKFSGPLDPSSLTNISLTISIIISRKYYLAAVMEKNGKKYYFLRPRHPHFNNYVEVDELFPKMLKFLPKESVR